MTIKIINIGGGLSSTYDQAEEPSEFSFHAYRHALQKSVPGLFSGKYQIVTEFGRCLLLKAGTTLSKIHHVKHWIKARGDCERLSLNQLTQDIL